MQKKARANSLKDLAKSFSYAFKGVFYCIENERNMRIHLVVAVLIVLFSFFYKLTKIESVLLAITIGLVISAEMVNTAIETMVNLQSPSYNNLARIAKDVAAGAVLVAALVAVIVAGFVFIDIGRLSVAFSLILSKIWAIAMLLAAMVFGLFFIFKKNKPLVEKPTRVYKITNTETDGEKK